MSEQVIITQTSPKIVTISGAGTKGDQGVPGPTGPAGSKWYTGAGAPSSGTGVTGDFYLNTSSGSYYEKTDANTWTVRGSLTGPAGATGAAGADGADGTSSAWHVGSGAPAGALGADTDLYLDDTNGDVYEKAAGAWSAVANIMGPAGSRRPGFGALRRVSRSSRHDGGRHRHARVARRPRARAADGGGDRRARLDGALRLRSGGSRLHDPGCRRARVAS